MMSMSCRISFFVEYVFPTEILNLSLIVDCLKFQRPWYRDFMGGKKKVESLTEHQVLVIMDVWDMMVIKFYNIVKVWNPDGVYML